MSLGLGEFEAIWQQKMATTGLQFRNFPGAPLFHQRPSVRETRCFDLHGLYQPKEPWRTWGCQDHKRISTKSGSKIILSVTLHWILQKLDEARKSSTVNWKHLVVLKWLAYSQMNKLQRYLALNNFWTSDHHFTVVAQRCIVQWASTMS